NSYDEALNKQLLSRQQAPVLRPPVESERVASVKFTWKCAPASRCDVHNTPAAAVDPRARPARWRVPAGKQPHRRARPGEAAAPRHPPAQRNSARRGRITRGAQTQVIDHEPPPRYQLIHRVTHLRRDG